MPPELRRSLKSKKSIIWPSEDQEAIARTGKRESRPFEPSRYSKSKKSVIWPTEDQETIARTGKRKSRPSDFASASRSRTRYDDATLLKERYPGRMREDMIRCLPIECQPSSGHAEKRKTKVPQGQNMTTPDHNQANIKSSGTKHGLGTSSVHARHVVETSVPKASGSRWFRKDHLSQGEQPLLTVGHDPANSLDGNNIGPMRNRHEAADSEDEYTTSSGTDTHWPVNSLDEDSISAGTDTHWPANSGDENTTSSGSSGSMREHGSPSPKSTTLKQWVHGLETSVDQDHRSEGKKSATQTRGVSTGAKYAKEVKKNGKYKISFLPGETVATENNTDLSNAIGIIVKASAELQGVTSWKEVSDSNKQCCYTKLFRWFTIEDWSTDRVYKIIDKKFQSAYTRWRSILNKIYHDLLDEGTNPRDVCPRKDLDMVRWQAACDFIEDENFQKRSQTNKRNRKKMRFTHTTGRIPIICRYKDMKEKNKIELFRITRTRKSGKFVNPEAESTYEAMVKMQQQAQEAGDAISEEAIMRSNLGVRCGYVKGMGHGVDVNHNRDICSESISEMVLVNLSDLVSTKEKVTSLEGMINNLQVQMTRMEKCVQQIAGIPSHKSPDL